MNKTRIEPLQQDELFYKSGKRKYRNPDAPKKLIKYVTRTNKKSDKDLISWGGFGISESLGTNTIINQFYEVQKLHTREGDFGRYMDHEVYSFSDSTQTAIRNLNIDLDELAREMAQDFYETDHCQVVYGVHEPDETDSHIHIHFAINTVNFANGNKRRENMRQTKEREARFQEMTKRAIKRYSYGKREN